MGCFHAARGAHDGLARAVSPPHASVDGDAFVAIATGQVPAAQDTVRWLAVQVVEEAIRSVAAGVA
jgi:L-aminopeptidase/D-esterase-like protein